MSDEDAEGEADVEGEDFDHFEEYSAQSLEVHNEVEPLEHVDELADHSPKPREVSNYDSLRYQALISRTGHRRI